MTSASAFVLMQFSCVQSTGTLYCQKIIFILSACILFGICSIKNEHFWCEGGGNKASPQITAFLQKRMPPLCTTDLRDRSGGTHEVHQSGSWFLSSIELWQELLWGIISISGIFFFVCLESYREIFCFVRMCLSYYIHLQDEILKS